MITAHSNRDVLAEQLGPRHSYITVRLQLAVRSRIIRHEEAGNAKTASRIDQAGEGVDDDSRILPGGIAPVTRLKPNCVDSQSIPAIALSPRHVAPALRLERVRRSMICSTG